MDADTLEGLRRQSDTALEVFQALFANRYEFHNQAAIEQFFGNMQSPDDTEILNQLLQWTNESIALSAVDGLIYKNEASAEALGRSIEPFVKTIMDRGPGAVPSLWPVVSVVQ